MPEGATTAEPTFAAVSLAGRSALLLSGAGPLIERRQDALDLVGEAMGCGAAWIVIPAERLSAAFFDLRSGLAGEVAQAFVNYRKNLAVVGDISRHLEASKALRDWVRECDRGVHVWFATDLDALEARLSAQI